LWKVVRQQLSWGKGVLAVAAKKGKKPKFWIEKAIEKPGALRSQLGVKKGETIPEGKLESASKKSGKLGKRARLAMTLKKISRRKK
jgi:hypothetical protein